MIMRSVRGRERKGFVIIYIVIENGFRVFESSFIYSLSLLLIFGDIFMGR